MYKKRIDKNKISEKLECTLYTSEDAMDEKFVNNALSKTQGTVYSMPYQNRSLREKACFSRPSRCKITFPQLIAFLLNASKKSIQVELNRFILEEKFMCDTYSKQAFSKRRQCVKPEAIQELFQLITKEFYKDLQYKTYQGMMVVAIDGSRINLPNTPDLKEFFGEQISNGAPQNQALCSCAFDVLNGAYMDALLVPCKSSERNLAEKHIDFVRDTLGFKDVLYLFDRGYPSAQLLKKVADSGAKYLFRCDKSVIRSMKLTGDDCTISHKFSKLDKPETVRIVKLLLPDGEQEILMTNLPEEGFAAEEIGMLYRLRWGIETSYDHAKNTIQIENFSGNSHIAVLQDFYAAMYLFNLASGMIFEQEQKFDTAHNKEENKYEYKQNLSVTIGILKPVLTEIVLTPSNAKKGRLLKRVFAMLTNATTRVEPDRHFEREKTHLSLKHHPTRRPIC